MGGKKKLVRWWNIEGGRGREKEEEERTTNSFPWTSGKRIQTSSHVRDLGADSKGSDAVSSSSLICYVFNTDTKTPTRRDTSSSDSKAHLQESPHLVAKVPSQLQSVSSDVDSELDDFRIQ